MYFLIGCMMGAIFMFGLLAVMGLLRLHPDDFDEYDDFEE